MDVTSLYTIQKQVRSEKGLTVCPPRIHMYMASATYSMASVASGDGLDGRSFSTQAMTSTLLLTNNSVWVMAFTFLRCRLDSTEAEGGMEGF